LPQADRHPAIVYARPNVADAVSLVTLSVRHAQQLDGLFLIGSPGIEQGVGAVPHSTSCA